MPRTEAIFLVIALAVGAALMVTRRSDFRPDLAYGSDPQEMLDLCLPRSGTGPFPAMLMIHGGGWSEGDKIAFRPFCDHLAKAGFVVATMNYRLADTGSTAATWPSRQIGDVQLAIRWLRTHAARWKIDPERICALGESAGGYLAVYAGTSRTILPGDVSGQLPDQSPALDCLIDFYGPVDLTHPGSDYLASAYSKLLGRVSLANNPGLYRDASPLFMVSPDTVPILIIQGTADNVVLPDQSERLLRALQNNGVTAHLITYPGGHTLKGLDSSQMMTLFDQAAAFAKAETAKNR